MSKLAQQPGFFGSFFGFQRMVSPFFITLVYFLGFAAILIATAAALYKGPKMYLAGFGLDTQSLLMQISGYGAIVIAGLLMLLAWRFVCELQMVLFGVFNRLSQIRELLQNTSLFPDDPEANAPATILSAHPPAPPPEHVEVTNTPAPEPEPVTEPVGTKPVEIPPDAAEAVTTEPITAEPVADKVTTDDLDEIAASSQGYRELLQIQKTTDSDSVIAALKKIKADIQTETK